MEINNENNNIKNVKVYKKLLTRVATFFLTTSISISTFYSVGNGLPFYKDDVKKPKYSKNIIINNELVFSREEKNVKDISNKIYLFGKWEKIDNEYKRKINVYDGPSSFISTKDIVSLMKNKNDIEILLEEIFGKPMVSYEVKPFINDEDNNEEVHMIIYIKEGYFIEKESDEENFYNTLIILGTIFGINITYYILDKINAKTRLRK